jgi:hypothetical protein
METGGVPWPPLVREGPTDATTSLFENNKTRQIWRVSDEPPERIELSTFSLPCDPDEAKHGV